MDGTLQTLMTRYPSRRGRLYTRLRAGMCPFELMERLMPAEGVVADVGCAEGVFAYYLALGSPRRTVIGYDLDQRKIDLATRAAEPQPNLTFRLENVLTADYPELAGAAMSDFLHHLSPSDQEQLLDQLTAALKPDGVLLIKEIDESGGYRRHLSRLADLVLYPKDKIHYRVLDRFAEDLRGRGFQVELIRGLVPRMPLSTNLLVCRKIG